MQEIRNSNLSSINGTKSTYRNLVTRLNPVNNTRYLQVVQYMESHEELRQFKLVLMVETTDWKSSMSI